MAAPIKYEPPGFTENRIEVPAEDEPDPESPASGWNPYRGQEAHGVPIVGGYEADLEDTVEETYKDRTEPPRTNLKDEPVTVVVEGYADKVLSRIVASDNRLPLPINQWVKVLEDYDRRTSAYLWFDPAPEAGHRIYFQMGSKDKPSGLCPSITNGGQQVGLYPLETTREVWVLADNVPAAGGTYMVNIIEEREVQA